MTTRTPDLKALAENLQYVIVTMQNDDLTEPGTEKRYRHVSRCEVIGAVVAALRAAPDTSGAEPVAVYIEREALAILGKDKTASATVSSGLLAKPFGDKVPLYASPPPADVDAVRKALRELDGIMQGNVSSGFAYSSADYKKMVKLVTLDIPAALTAPVAGADASPSAMLERAAALVDKIRGGTPQGWGYDHDECINFILSLSPNAETAKDDAWMPMYDDIIQRGRKLAVAAGMIPSDVEITIDRSSRTTSFPYLAIAQQYEVPYNQVLKFSDELDEDMPAEPYGISAWVQATIAVWLAERQRRCLVDVVSSPPVTAEELQRAAALNKD